MNFVSFEFLQKPLRNPTLISKYHFSNTGLRTSPIWACLAVFIFALPAVVCGAGQNVVVVLDDSGSMDDRMRSKDGRVRKIEAAKQALLTVLEQLPEDAKVGVALLNGKVNRSPWLIPLGPVNVNQTRRAIQSVRAKGGTPLGQFMKVASDALLELRDEEYYGSYRLLIVTDGEAGDNNLVERFLPEIKGRGITVDVIGVNMQSDHSLATKVHSYRRADDPESLTQAIREVFAETTSTGDAGESDFELLEGLPMECASAALTALATIENAPIGERPQKRIDSIDGPSPLNQNAPGNQPAAPRSRFGLFVLAFIAIFVIRIFLKIAKATNR